MSTANGKLILSPTRLAMFRLFGIVLAIVGAILTVGGIKLISLSASWYYAVIGIGWFVAGILAFRGAVLGLYRYLVTFLITLGWSLWEAGLDGWALLPRSPFRK